MNTCNYKNHNFINPCKPHPIIVWMKIKLNFVLPFHLFLSIIFQVFESKILNIITNSQSMNDFFHKNIFSYLFLSPANFFHVTSILFYFLNIDRYELFIYFFLLLLLLLLSFFFITNRIKLTFCGIFSDMDGG